VQNPESYELRDPYVYLIQVHANRESFRYADEDEGEVRPPHRLYVIYFALECLIAAARSA
jgi:hypothetical protein